MAKIGSEQGKPWTRAESDHETQGDYNDRERLEYAVLAAEAEPLLASRQRATTSALTTPWLYNLRILNTSDQTATIRCLARRPSVTLGTLSVPLQQLNRDTVRGLDKSASCAGIDLSDILGESYPTSFHSGHLGVQIPGFERNMIDTVPQGFRSWIHGFAWFLGGEVTYEPPYAEGHNGRTTHLNPADLSCAKVVLEEAHCLLVVTALEVRVVVLPAHRNLPPPEWVSPAMNEKPMRRSQLSG